MQRQRSKKEMTNEHNNPIEQSAGYKFFLSEDIVKQIRDGIMKLRIENQDSSHDEDCSSNATKNQRQSVGCGY